MKLNISNTADQKLHCSARQYQLRQHNLAQNDAL